MKYYKFKYVYKSDLEVVVFAGRFEECYENFKDTFGYELLNGLEILSVKQIDFYQYTFIKGDAK